jgi:hypothetical protein
MMQQLSDNLDSANLDSASDDARSSTSDHGGYGDYARPSKRLQTTTNSATVCFQIYVPYSMYNCQHQNVSNGAMADNSYNVDTVSDLPEENRDYLIQCGHINDNDLEHFESGSIEVHEQWEAAREAKLHDLAAIL